jgi:hypothetical protein
MKVPTLVAVALLAACGSTATIKSNSSTLNDHSGNHITLDPNFQFDSVLTNITAYSLVLDSCVEDLSKVSNETRSRLGINAIHNERNACKKLISQIYPEIRHSYDHARVSKRSRPETNTTQTYYGKEHHLSLAKKQKLFAKEKLKCLTALQSKGDGFSHDLGRERSRCISKASKVVEALDRDLANVEDHVLEHGKRNLEGKPNYMDEWVAYRKKEDAINEDFRVSIDHCTDDLSHNSTMGTEDFRNSFVSCIKGLAERNARGLVAIEKELPPEEFSLKPKHRVIELPEQLADLLRREEATEADESLRQNLARCRVKVLSNSTVLTEHGLDYSTKSFGWCVKMAATIYGSRLRRLELGLPLKVSWIDSLKDHLKARYTSTATEFTNNSLTFNKRELDGLEMVKLEGMRDQLLKI